MKPPRAAALLFLAALLCAAAPAREPSIAEFRAVQESLSRIPPKLRMVWLHDRGIELPGQDGTQASDSGLRFVGKWGRGPAGEVTGRDTLVVLTLGSEVALLSFANPDSPRVLSEIQFQSVVYQSCLRESLLYTSSRANIEIWNIADPFSPVRLGQLPGLIGDFWVQDTLLYFIASDTFHVFNTVNPANPVELGMALETGWVTAGSSSTVIACQNSGFAFIDVSNPANPHRAGFFSCGQGRSAFARGDLVCASFDENSYPYAARFVTLDISDPANPVQLGRLNDAGGYDIYVEADLAFVSGRGPGVENPQPFQVLNIADPAHPTIVDTCRTTDRTNWGVWADLSRNRAYVADDFDGLAVVDISDVSNVVLDTWLLSAGPAVDVDVDGQYCYVAGDIAGLRILDVSDPTMPNCVSGLDIPFRDAICSSVTARDSFAYVGWRIPWLRSVDVSDPTQPVLAGSCDVTTIPEDMVLRDTFLYVAEDNVFQVVNVARPRQPQVVGTCGLPERTRGLFVKDTFAYVAQGYTGLVILSVARPDAPSELGRYQSVRSTHGVWVEDTIAYIAEFDSGLTVASVASPQSAHKLGSRLTPGWAYDVIVVDSVAYVSCYDGIRAYDVRNPRNPIEIGFHTTPTYAWRLSYGAPYLYLACADAGVCIFETTAVAVEEPRQQVGRKQKAEPTFVRGAGWMDISQPGIVMDAAGRRVAEVGPGRARPELKAGVYFVRDEGRGAGDEGRRMRKIVVLD